VAVPSPRLGEIRNCHINVGTGKELTIKALANLVKDTVGFEGEIVWDTTKPNGTPRKLIDVSEAAFNLGWHHKVEIEDGVLKGQTVDLIIPFQRYEPVGISISMSFRRIDRRL
jgi:nucleoside-diphosphate-sugar epimerase